MNLTKMVTKMGVKGNKVTRGLGKVEFMAKKHSPLILAVSGAVGLVSTAVLAYKAAPKVEAIVEDMEANRALEERYIQLSSVGTEQLTDEGVVELYELKQSGDYVFDKKSYIIKLVKASALPIAVGAASLACFAFSYKILNGRVMSLAGLVSTMAAEKVERDRHAREVLSEEEYSRLTRPVEPKEVEVSDGEGGTKIISGEAKSSETNIYGAWFSDSSEFVRDDNYYNLQWISSAEQRLNTVLATRGYILLNEVFDELAIPRIPEGQILGWSFGDGFDLTKDLIDTMDNGGNFYTEIFIKWPEPKSIYEDVNYNGRYNFMM